MPSSRDRAISIVELLAHEVQGLPMSEIADRLGIPRTAAHRLLADLREMGYVKQEESGGRYFLTVKLASLGLAYLAASGITDIAQPLLNDLAKATGELVRLAVIDGTRLVWVAKAQGARTGLRLDPDAGMEVYLPASASGLAWLASMSDERALELAAQHGFSQSRSTGPGAPQNLEELMRQIRQTRERGYGLVVDAYELGTSAIAAVVRRGLNGEPVGTISVAGPTARMTPERLKAMSTQVLACAESLAFASLNSPMLFRN